MPKVVSETEREQTREAIYTATLALIAQKGLRKVTVDDIAKTVGFGKGSFYAYYPSREVCVYEAIRRYEAESFAKMEAALTQMPGTRQQNEQTLRDIFLQNGVLFSISPIDLEVILRKLPPEYREKDQQKSMNYFERGLKMLRIDEEKMEAVALLTDCIGMVISAPQFSERGKEQAMDVLISAIAGFMPEGKQR